MTLPSDLPSRRALLAAFGLISVALAALVVLARPWGPLHELGLIVGIVTVLAAIRAWKTTEGRWLTWTLFGLSLQAGLFVLSAAGTPPLARFRLIQLAAIVSYLALLGLVLLGRWTRLAPRTTFVLVAATALAVLAGDSILGFGAPAGRVPPRQDWPDSADAHPRLRKVPRPSIEYRKLYRDDLGGYLQEEDLRVKSWYLGVTEGSIARLVVSPENPGRLRVEITKASPDVYHVQLTQSRFSVERRAPYFITFRARADRPRKGMVEFARNHPPWTSLGLNPLEFEMTTQWKEYRAVFTARATEPNSRLTFSLGASNFSVEIDSVALRIPPDGTQINPTSSGQSFFIVHQRNSTGCRDRDYTVPRAGQTVRILALGDAFTTGDGVYEQDTFASRLERELNSRGQAEPHPWGYEVINCGVSGYGTREQLLFYELIGATYRPDIVLVTMGWNDGRFYWEESLRESFRQGPSRLAGLSLVARKVETSLRLRPKYDYRRSVEDLLALDKAARLQGARLIVAVSRHGPPGLGDQLLATVRKGLEGTSIPLLDLGTLEAGDSIRDARTSPGPRAHQAAAAALLQWLRKDVFPDEASRPTPP